jgi:hypothetical protein
MMRWFAVEEVMVPGRLGPEDGGNACLYSLQLQGELMPI